MNRNLKLIFTLVIIIPATGFSQYKLIKDKDADFALIGVNIYSGQNGVTTDSNGICNFEIFNENDEIIISHIGYEIIKEKKTNLADIILLKKTNIPISEVSVISFKSKKEQRRYNKLERDVLRVYPYALLVGDLLIEYSDVMEKINELSFFERRKEKKRIFTLIENKLISKYGHRVKRLTKSQGRILIRLVDRETKYTSHQIIKSFRGFFIAGFWQITAVFFGHNLKSKFNSEIGEDKLIEHIIVNKIIK